MRYRESREERQKKIERAKELLKETPPENDVLAMIIAAFIVFLPVLIIICFLILIIGFLLW